MTGGSLIDYEALTQEAMRGVVKTVLVGVAKNGLPGDHHFYVSFDTQAAGVSLSKRLKEKYPDEMTIVLQHRFWDLSVGDDRFEVKLTFDGIPERLVIPYSAIRVFFDPSVRFGLQFEEAHTSIEDGSASGRRGRDPGLKDLIVTGGDNTRPPRRGIERKSRPGRGKAGSRNDTAQAEPPVVGATEPAAGTTGKTEGVAPEGGTPTVEQAPSRPRPVAVPSSKPVEPAAPAGGGAQVVSLDAFRKK
jgi:hypothetical protein